MLGSSLPVLDMTYIEFPLLLHSYACLDFTLLIYGIAKLELVLPVLHFVTLGSSLLPRSLMRVGSTMSTYGVG